MASTDPQTGYAPVNDIELYYEIHGEGEPLVLLHGGVGASEMFGANLQELAKSRQVIAVHLQAHGRTADVDRTMGYEAMADDIAALIGHLGFERSDVMGYSLGGGVSLQTAIRHPEVVRKLVLVSSPFKREGWYPEVLAGMQMGPEAAESMTQSPLYDLYPHANWRALITKLSDLLRRDYDWSKDVEALKPQTMLVYADADAVRMAHIVEFFGLLGGGKRDAGLDGTGRPESWLAIVPGETHYDVGSSPKLAAVVEPFLDAPMPENQRSDR
jgi:pimeloyl-ACP methyl ester carboxylesterase